MFVLSSSVSGIGAVVTTGVWLVQEERKVAAIIKLLSWFFFLKLELRILFMTKNIYVLINHIVQMLQERERK